ncbi:hypothetical protein M0208_02095 [Sphingomonas sp. SUN019]|uniref:hypothetical protein n=1 Tax=Sphingomonas sp. SUN019 TaxID=2937788 RepID=UPI002164CC1F|nr:hypothetical protein [Sphingomonas sp. SUN019]UVO49367.1 hypothetical protein M0208_02095 [Sphingomonas sp. SUN019]
MRHVILIGFGLLLSAAAASPPTIASLLAGTAGRWQGELQYRDYQSNKWEGLPVKVAIVAQPDALTTVRTAEFDDGPTTGLVWITTLSTIDPATGKESYASARKGKPFESGSAQLTLPSPPRDATHWTIVATDTRNDGNGMAKVRETTVRDGARMTTQKDVDPIGDGKDEWLPRNRTALTLIE